MNKNVDSREPLVISFSGGRTSAYMLLHCLKYMRDRQLHVVFANTGCEHKATLDFVYEMDKHTGNQIVWLEAVVSMEPGLGIRHRIVDYQSASRNGEPFEAAIKKYGIFNPRNPSCTARLKTEVIDSYVRSLGFKTGRKSKNYETAIGIRADEVDRISVNAKANKWIYPLVNAGITKKDILDFWRLQPFDLAIAGDHYGNCVWCWKKSLRKHLTLARESPSVFEFPKRMELQYGNGQNSFFRGYRNVDEIFELSKGNFDPYKDNHEQSLFPNEWDRSLDIEDSCGASCEIHEVEQ